MGKVDIIAYSDKYKKGVVSCLQRNYLWMSQKTESYIGEWISSVTDFEWSDVTMLSQEEYPFRRGLVLLANEEVVGYLGCITSNRPTESGDSYIYCDPTTWAIDKNYRFFFPKAVNNIIQSFDFIADFTPRESVRETFKSLYKFNVYLDKTIYLYPVPNELETLDFLWISNVKQIDSELLKREFLDHKSICGVKLVRLEDANGDIGYIFYKRYNEDSARLRILKIVNSSLFAANCREVVWKLLYHEFYGVSIQTDSIINILSNVRDNKKICVECDGVLLNGEKINHPVTREKVCYGLYNHIPCGGYIDYMYSEYALLPNMI